MAAVRLEGTSAGLEEAVRRLAVGELVAVPTETVYGLGALALSPEAVVRIFEAKARPHFDPLICHVHDVASARRLSAHFDPRAERLAEAFWPGPLTLIVPKTDEVPDIVTSGQPTVGVRVPAHPLTRALLEQLEQPVAAPSANPFGATSPTRAEHVLEQLGDRIEAVLDGGPCEVGLESSIVAVLPGEPLRLLRPGGLALEVLEDVAGPIEVPPPRAFPTASPGRLERHYAPRTSLTLVTNPESSSPAPRAGLLAFETSRPGYGAVEILSPSGDLVEAARNLFGALRRLDAAGLEHIEAEAVPETGLGRAIMDRLRRAAAGSRPCPRDASRLGKDA